MGAGESKQVSSQSVDQVAVTNANVLAPSSKATSSGSSSGWGDNYEKLLLDPTLKPKFDRLEMLFRRNDMNDINYIAAYIAEVQKKKSPVLIEVSKRYSQMLKDVVQIEPSISTDQDSYKYLADDNNILKFYFTKLQAENQGWKQIFTGNENEDTAKRMTEFMHSMHLHEAKLLFFQFKYAQNMLFQAACSHCTWDIAGLFVDQTLAFHRARESMFKNVFRQIASMTAGYIGMDAINLDDIDEIKKMQGEVDKVKKLYDAREKLEKQRLVSVKDALKMFIVKSDIGNGSMLPLLSNGEDAQVPAYLSSLNTISEKPVVAVDARDDLIATLMKRIESLEKKKADKKALTAAGTPTAAVPGKKKSGNQKKSAPGTPAPRAVAPGVPGAPGQS
jgi:hypothetical protein